MKKDSNRIKQAMDETILKDIDVTEDEKRRLLNNLHAPQKAKRSYKKYYIGLSAAVLVFFLAALPFMVDFNGGQFMTNSSQESSTGSGDSSTSEMEDAEESTTEMEDKRTGDTGASEDRGESLPEKNADGSEEAGEESSSSWAYSFVQWNGKTYVITETEVAAERIENEIGEVTTFSNQAGADESGNFSNRFEEGTKYYELQDTDTDEAIAVKRGDRYIKAISREKWIEENRN